MKPIEVAAIRCSEKYGLDSLVTKGVLQSRSADHTYPNRFAARRGVPLSAPHADSGGASRSIWIEASPEGRTLPSASAWRILMRHLREEAAQVHLWPREVRLFGTPSRGRLFVVDAGWLTR